MAAVVLSKPLLIWLLPHLVGNEPLAVTALYRPGGDIQYFEILSAVARGNLGESNVAELAGTGVQAFPLATIVLHALGFAALGAWGLLVADVIATYAFHAVLVLTLRLARLPERVAQLFSLSVIASIPFAVSLVTERLGFGAFLMWGDRFPRPLLAETFLLGGVAVGSAILVQRQKAPGVGFWILAGLTLGLLVQADIYGAFVVLQALAITLGWVIFTAPRDHRRAWLQGVAVGVASMAIVLVPFGLQRSGSHPDVARRFGLHAVSRAEAFSWIGLLPARVPLVVGVAGVSLIVWWRRRRAASDDGTTALIVAQWTLLTALAYLALPLFGAILGRAIQLYHFSDRLSRFASYAIAIIAVHTILSFLDRHRQTRGVDPGRAARVGAVATALVVLACAGAIGARAWKEAHDTRHVRPSYFRFEALGSYRPAFAELVRELEREPYRDVEVLATFDHQVHSYWQTFRGGRTFVPDVFVSTVTDSEAERRLAALCAALGMTGDQFEQFVQKPWVNTFWLGLAKYATNRSHALFPRSEYTPAQVVEMDKRSIMNAWNLQIPPAEIARLRRVFDDTAPRWGDAGRMHTIVLTRDAELAGYVPDPGAFRPTFENAVFRVYLRR